MAMPTSVPAEWSVIAHMLAQPEVIGEIIGVPLEQQDFSLPETRLLYATTVERHYAGKPVDPLVVGELVRDELAQYWGMADNSTVAPKLVEHMRESMVRGAPVEQAAVIKRLSTAR